MNNSSLNNPSKTIPDYTAGVSCPLSLGSEKTYIADSDGFIRANLSAFDGSQAYIKINGNDIMKTKGNSNPDFNSLTASFIVGKGDEIKYFSGYGDDNLYNEQNIIFYPYK